MDVGVRHPTFGLDTQKKTLAATERNQHARSAYRKQVAQHRADAYIIVDECGTNINFTSIYARAPKGERAIGSVPRNTDKNTTLIASMTTQGMGPAMLVAGATDSATFEAYIEHFLTPALTPGQIVVLDNLSAHKRERIRVLIEAHACTVQYLPSYSPDLSPIEEAFSKLKTLLRRAAARTREALHDAIATVLAQITARDAHGYFAHCGYGAKVQ